MESRGRESDASRSATLFAPALGALVSFVLLACGSSGTSSAAPNGDATTDAASDGASLDGTLGDADETSTDALDETLDTAETLPAVCVDGASQSCHFTVHTTDEGVIDCTTGNQLCVGGQWALCGAPLPFCTSGDFTTRVQLFATSDDPPAFAQAWNDFVTKYAVHSVLAFNRLTTTPASVLLQVLADEDPDAGYSVGAAEITDPFGAPVGLPVGVDPISRALDAVDVGTLQFQVNNYLTTYTIPVASVGFGGALDATCDGTDSFTLTLVIPQSGATVAFADTDLATSLGPVTTHTPVDGWTVTLATLADAGDAGVSETGSSETGSSETSVSDAGDANDTSSADAP